MGPLAESHATNLKLARENGALSERVAALEREHRTRQATSAPDRQAFEALQQRLDAAVGANIALAELLRSQTLESEQAEPAVEDRGPWPWLLLMVIGSIVVATLILWLIWWQQSPW